MKYFLAIGILLIIGCGKRSTDFEKYSKQLEPLSTPLVVKTIEYPERKALENYDSALFEKYKLRDAQAPYGKIYDDNNITGIVYTVAGDIAVPVLVTYDKAGRKTDS